MMFVEACAMEHGYGALAHGLDLRLAENYLPGGVGLLKGFVLSCLLYCVELHDTPIWFAVLALGLAFDRVESSTATHSYGGCTPRASCCTVPRSRERVG